MRSVFQKLHGENAGPGADPVSALIVNVDGEFHLTNTAFKSVAVVVGINLLPAGIGIRGGPFQVFSVHIVNGIQAQVDGCVRRAPIESYAYCSGLL